MGRQNSIRTYFLICSILYSSNVFSQQLEKGDHVLSPSFGVGGIYPVFGSVNTQTPLFGLSYEYGAFDRLGPGSVGIGGFLGYKAYKRIEQIDGNSYFEKLHYMVLGVKGSYHYNPFKKVKGLDPYAGLMLSLNVPDYANNYTDKYKYLGSKYRGYLAGTVYVGAHFFFTENMGAFAEAGFGTAFFSLGMNFKF